ncbi:putative NBD/HSP70 family sugar kinase [Rhodobium orientis]|uniref:Uncharacterized protein n=1 Tax=Rhodobium orientis TaxID=34017 RepID=A0A327JZ02_9HYPH|nr:ROK family transcriptional regulator [Rhodobium orientis]MBB4303531.1 putative NBD/HSP70 family sugar kinase [Rhodobium orientis]MBK5950461.1 hypothetical protein [Rhodobium orientis]RAI28318.1 hypothetical protein CH339_06765 [Rhodobium orientis]
MLKGTNNVQAKLNNLWVVFEAARIHGPLSRTRISEVTGLSKQAASVLVDQLLELGFVKEEKSKERRVGKPPKPVFLNDDGAFTIGLHVDYGRMSGVAMNLGGRILEREGASLTEFAPDRVAEKLAGIAQRLLERVEMDRDRFYGIGLATPGPFGVAGISPPRLPGWDGVTLAEHLRTVAGVPVALANDGQCAVSAEGRFGETARTLGNFVYIYLGNGLGTGIMVDGAAFGGNNGNAGELGHTIAITDGHPCICGKRGCLETYVSIDSLRRFLEERGQAIADIGELDSLSAEMPAVSEWIDIGAEPLRIGVNALENLFDPETIMLGGDAPAWLIDAFIERTQPLYPSVSQVSRKIPRLMKAELGADAVIRGAAILPVLSRLNPHYSDENMFA